MPHSGADLVAAWNNELHDPGFTPPTNWAREPGLQIGRINRDVAANLVLTRLGAKRSAWNAADIRGEVERLIASVGVVAERAIRHELVEDIADRARTRSRPLLERGDVPEHVRSLASERVLAVESDLVDTFAARAAQLVTDAVRLRGIDYLDPAQKQVVAALTGYVGLLVTEGAAGTGKTTTLAAARDVLDDADRRLVVVTPTLKAAQAAQQQVGADAFSAAWLIHQHSYRWDEDGHWSHTDAAPEARARLLPGDVLLVDEAGMLDQDTARALFAIADRAHATVALLGDRHQLPAVGRGGVLDLATRWVSPNAHHELESVHRFSDPAYADLSLRMRSGELSGEVFDAARSSSTPARSNAQQPWPLLAPTVLMMVTGSSSPTPATRSGCSTQPSVTAAMASAYRSVSNLLSALVSRMVSSLVSPSRAVVSESGSATASPPDATTATFRWPTATPGPWPESAMTAACSSPAAGQRVLSAEYVREHVELAFTTTAYGAQGETVDSAHFVLGETTGAASAYVAMTRGRHHNTAHLVAESVDGARSQWVEVFNRDRADLGPRHAAQRAADDIDRYGPNAPPPSAGLQAAALRDGPRRSPQPMRRPRGSPMGSVADQLPCVV